MRNRRAVEPASEKCIQSELHLRNGPRPLPFPARAELLPVCSQSARAPGAPRVGSGETEQRVRTPELRRVDNKTRSTAHVLAPVYGTSIQSFPPVMSESARPPTAVTAIHRRHMVRHILYNSWDFWYRVVYIIHQNWFLYKTLYVKRY